MSAGVEGLALSSASQHTGSALDFIKNNRIQLISQQPHESVNDDPVRKLLVTPRPPEELEQVSHTPQVKTCSNGFSQIPHEPFHLDDTESVVSIDWECRVTLKYLLVVFASLALSTMLIFLITIGALNIHKCPSVPTIPIYLVVMGVSGFLRIVLFYACPYQYSHSLIHKMYTQLVRNNSRNANKAVRWHLKHRQRNREANVVPPIHSESRVVSINDDSTSQVSFSSSIFQQRINLLLTNLFTGTTAQSRQQHAINLEAQLITSPNGLYNQHESNSSQNGRQMRRSASESRVVSSNNATLSMPRSATFANDGRTKKRSRSSLTKSESKGHIAGRRYGLSRTGALYVDNKRQPSRRIQEAQLRIIDPSTVRFMLGVLVQRALDIFVLTWFVFGNYWLFHVAAEVQEGTRTGARNESVVATVEVLKTTPLSSTSETPHQRLLHRKHRVHLSNRSKESQILINQNGSFVTLSDKANRNVTGNLKSFNCNPLCYQTAFYQIVATYGLIALIAICMLAYRSYSVFHRSKLPTNNRQCVNPHRYPTY